jgi:Na+/pantothenate symporter
LIISNNNRHFIIECYIYYHVYVAIATIHWTCRGRRGRNHVHVSCIYNYLCNQCISPLMLWVLIPLMPCLLKTTLCDKVCQWLAAGRWFSPGTLISSINKTDRYDKAEIMLKVALTTCTITLTLADLAIVRSNIMLSFIFVMVSCNFKEINTDILFFLIVCLYLYCRYISSYQSDRIDAPLTDFIMPYVCACPKPWPKFQHHKPHRWCNG